MLPFLKYLLIVLPTLIAIFEIAEQLQKRKQKKRPWYKIPSKIQWSLILFTLILFALNIWQENRSAIETKISKNKIDSLNNEIKNVRLSNLTKMDSLSVYYITSINLKESGFERLITYIDSISLIRKMTIRINDTILIFSTDIAKDLKPEFDHEFALKRFLNEFEIGISLVKSKNFEEARRVIADCSFLVSDHIRFNQKDLFFKNLEYNQRSKILIIRGQSAFSHKYKCNEKYLSETDMPGSFVFIDMPIIIENNLELNKLYLVNANGQGIKVSLKNYNGYGIQGFIPDSAKWVTNW
jgi:hypothetical protein